MKTSICCGSTKDTCSLCCLIKFNANKISKIAVSILLILFVSACGSETKSNNSAQVKSKAVNIIPHTVTLRPETITIEAVGTARAEKTAIIRADDGGEVIAVFFEAGDTVKKGDVLLSLQQDEERLAVEQAKVAYKNAQQNLKRIDGIKLAGAISRSRIDEAKIALEETRINLSLAEFALSRRQVRAPFSGVIGLTNIDAGARITSETEIARLDDRKNLFVDFQAPEEMYNRISIGDLISIEPFSNAGQKYQAKVRKINSRIDVNSRSFTVRTEVDNTDDTFRPGMSFKIEFQRFGRAYPIVPEAAIIWGGDGAYVWTIEESMAKRVSVTIVSRQAGQVLVRAPIAEGGIVVAEGVQKVREGSLVAFSSIYSSPQPNSLSAPLEQADITQTIVPEDTVVSPEPNLNPNSESSEPTSLPTPAAVSQ